MANEAILVLKYEDPIDFIVSNAATIAKGTVLKLSAPRTVAASDGDRDVIAGIAARDKVANDGRTRLAVYRRGVFRMVAKDAITAGDTVSSSATANKVLKGTAAAVASKTLGIALDTSANDGDLIEVELNIGAGANAFA
jgi:hypothetical protein